MNFIGNLNNIDFFIMFVTLISMFYGYIRGFAKESLSIFSLIISSLICIHLYPSISEYVKNYINLPVIADGISLLVLFFTIYSLLSIVTNLLLNSITNSSIKIIDKNFGIIFGFVRAIIILSLINIILTWTIWKKEIPKWLLEAKSTSIINDSSKLLLSFVPNEVLYKISTIFNTTNYLNRSREIINNNRINDFSEPALKKNTNENKEGYTKNDNESLDKLFNIENND